MSAGYVLNLLQVIVLKVFVIMMEFAITEKIVQHAAMIVAVQQIINVFLI